MSACWYLNRVTGVLSLVMITFGSAYASDRFQLDGYYKSFVVEYELPAVYFGTHRIDSPPLGSVSNRLRLDSRLRINRQLSMTIAYDIGPVIQDHSLFANQLTPILLDPFSYRVDDIKGRLYPSRIRDVASFAIYQNLDRAFVEIRTSRADFYVGRQAIAWGSARAVNPTDVLAPYSYETLDTEDRVGVDAVRARIPTGDLGELDVGYVFGRDFQFERSAFFVRSKLYVAHTDVSVMVVGFRENLMLGVDLARSVGGAGTWLEAAHTFADALTDERSSEARDFFRASLGVDYSLGDNTYSFLEYHFNQPGADRARDYLRRIGYTAYREGNTYLLGRHYLIPGLSHQITPLITGTFEVLWNLSDWSAYLTPGLEYNIAANIYLAGGAFVGVGQTPSPQDEFGSEFALYPDIFYTSFRVYF